MNKSLEMIGDYVRHLEEENSELQQKIDKAIEYLKQNEVRVIYQELGLQPMKDNDTLLEILGDKENE